MIRRFLFPAQPDSIKSSVLLLCMRLIFGVLLLSHGIQKWSGFQELSAVFPDPLGVGSPVSLGLAIFAEVFCALAFMAGFLYRLALIPMLFTMLVAFFVIHAADAFAVKELAFAYLVVFAGMYVAGPGLYSIDHLLAVFLDKKKG